MLKIRKVVVGISGGVDSAVTALLLKQKGYDVHGVFMQNWDIADEKGFCSADEDYKDASMICDKLGIKLTHVNFVKQYWNGVFSNLIKEYENGLTPNPDILCNRYIKFSYFYQFARDELNADAIATGHYARTSFGAYLKNYQPNEAVRLLLARDHKKDQTFFLSQVEQKALKKTMFPLGNLMKTEVKQLATESGLEKIALKKESMGICFIGTRNFQDFIKEYITDKPGNFVDVDNGKIVGKHNGVHQWTIGQRSCIPGVKKAFFIVRKDPVNNIIYVAAGTKHLSLQSNLIFTAEPHWIYCRPEELEKGNVLICKFKFQHTEDWVDCKVFEINKGLIIDLDKPKRAVTCGQYAVLSRDGECLGSAKIVDTVSHFSLYYLQNRQLHSFSELLCKYKMFDVESETIPNKNVRKINHQIV